MSNKYTIKDIATVEMSLKPALEMGNVSQSAFNSIIRNLTIGISDVEKMDEFYTVPQIAKLLDYHPVSIRRLIRQKKLTAFKLGSSEWRVRKEDLNTFLYGETA